VLENAADAIPRRGRHSTCREVDLRSDTAGSRASSCWLAATPAARLKLSEVVRHNSNAMTEGARRNRCGRFPAAWRARHGRRRPPRGMSSADATYARTSTCTSLCTYTYTWTFDLTFAFCRLPFDLTSADIIVTNASDD
jgi:hypothetical protein